MSRTFFSYTPPFRAPRGGPIIDLQKGLASAGDYPLGLDAMFAGQTTQAVRLWQTKAGAVASGAVDVITWLALTRSDTAALFPRCLVLKAAFEGQGYTLAVDNFDGAGLTGGVIGFTLLTGDRGDVLKTISTRALQVMSATFGPALPEIMGALDKSKAYQTTWANSVSLGPKKTGLHQDLQDALKQLGNQPVVRAIQDEFAHDLTGQRRATT